MEHTGTVRVVGSLNVDTTVDVEDIVLPGQTVMALRVSRGPGGKGLNQAVAAARHAPDVRMVGTVGGDENGDLLLETMSGTVRLDITDVRRSPPVATGEAFIQRDRRGENSIIVTAGANAATSTTDVCTALENVRPGDVVVCQLEIPTDTVAAALRTSSSRGAVTVLNAAPAASVQHLLTDVDVLVVNESEAEQLLGDGVPEPAEELAQRFSCSAVVTLGGAGSQVCDHEGSTRIPPTPVDIVDTTGAGDAFAGTLAARLAVGASVREACRDASVDAADVCTFPGALPRAAPTAI